jgi:VWFA-related protein
MKFLGGADNKRIGGWKAVLKIKARVFVLIALNIFLVKDIRPQHVNQVLLRHDVSVTLKLLQVYVTDKQGKAVNDLSKDDFEIWDDGEIQKITEFETHDLTLGVRRAGTEAQGLLSAPAVNRKYFFFFDFAFNDAAGILTSKKAALDFLDTRIRPGDEIGIISYDVYKGLVLNEYLSMDFLKIRGVIQGIRAKRYLGRAADIESDYLKSLKEVASALEGPASDWGISDMIRNLGDQETRNYELQVGGFIKAIEAFSKAVRYISGNKNIVLFSSGIAKYVMYGSEKYLTSFGTKYGNTHLRDTYMNMCESLAASNCSIYSINTSSSSSKRFLERDLAGDASLKQLAQETGGKYFDNIKGYEKINEEIQNITGSYYVLGYPITEKPDGEHHKIKVRVKRKGCEVHGQTGYFNPKPFTEYSEDEKVLHLIDLALSEKPHLQEAVDFPVSVLPYAVGEKTDLAVLAEIPVGKLAKVRGGVIEFVTIVFNDKNDIVMLRRKELSRWPASSMEAFAKSLISIPPGKYECRVVLRNMTTGRGARGSSQILVPGIPETGTLPPIYPLLLKPRKGTVFLGEEEAQKETPLTDIYPFDTTEYVPVIGELSRLDAKIRAIAPLPVNKGWEGDLTFSAFLINPASGEKGDLPISVLSHEKTRSGKDVFSLEIAIGGLNPGDYSLVILVDGLGFGVRLTARAPLSVE